MASNHANAEGDLLGLELVANWLELPMSSRLPSATAWMPESAALVRRLIQRLKDAEAGRDHAIHQVGVCSRECNRYIARNNQLEQALGRIARGEVPDRYEDYGPQLEDIARAALEEGQ